MRTTTRTAGALLAAAMAAGLLAGAGAATAAPGTPAVRTAPAAHGGSAAPAAPAGRTGGSGASVPNFWVLTSDGVLSRRSGRLPLLPVRSVRVGGLGGDRLTGIDVRPATGALYAIGSSGQLYTIDPNTGASTRIGTPNAIAGRSVGFDFNPTVDRIRVITSAGTNLRLHPDTGVIAGTDTGLAYAAGDAFAGRAPEAAAAGYTNSVAGALATTLYDIDAARDTLVTQGTPTGVAPVVSPNTGQLFTVGRLGLNVLATNGFDIDGRTGVAIGAFRTSALPVSVLATVDLRTGRAHAVSVIIGEVVGLAV